MAQQRKDKMNRKQKYQAIRQMESVGLLTDGAYPSQREFNKALSEGRVLGNYDGPRIRINSNNPYKDYQFMARDFFDRFFGEGAN
jgi:hypothetical protein